MFTIQVPATSANLGPGFDSIGVALNLYLELDVYQETDEWIIEHDLPRLAKDSRNLIIRTALKVCPQLKPHRLVMRSDIPTTRGLGSSSSAIVAGIELANQLGQLGLSLNDKIQLATKFEGHPDNVAPAIVGQLVVSAYTAGRVYWSKINLAPLAFIVCIPNTPLATKESRGVLPDSFSLAQAAQASAISNVLVSHLSRGYYHRMRAVIEKDKFHEPYRHDLVPELSEIRQLLKKQRTFGTYLSGAGPSVMTLSAMEHAETIQKQLQNAFPDYQVEVLTVNKTGVSVIHKD